ncbi:MAG: LytR C-terminal domain-containing protein [Elusimicrobiales bacterium]|nr:LytR C-terminal domain-containing protein [Elusimicrobiales bacterium]
MEQPTGKKAQLILAACLALGVAAAAWQYLSPASNRLVRGRDVTVALLGERSSALLVYHPFSGTVNAFSAGHPKPRKGVSLWQRASDLALAAGGVQPGESVFYIALSSAPDLERLWGPLDGWRADPRQLWRAAAWARGLRRAGATNLSGFELFTLFSELAGLGKSDFILTEVARRAPVQEEEEAAPPAPLVEVFNASGRPGLAAQTAKRLRALGFDVITEGTLPLQQRTRILGFSRDTAAALRLREALGLEELEIRVKSAQKSVAGAAVVLGQDFNSGKPGK